MPTWFYCKRFATGIYCERRATTFDAMRQQRTVAGRSVRVWEGTHTRTRGPLHSAGGGRTLAELAMTHSMDLARPVVYIAGITRCVNGVGARSIPSLELFESTMTRCILHHASRHVPEWHGCGPWSVVNAPHLCQSVKPTARLAHCSDRATKNLISEICDDALRFRNLRRLSAWKYTKTGLARSWQSAASRGYRVQVTHRR